MQSQYLKSHLQNYFGFLAKFGRSEFFPKTVDPVDPNVDMFVKKSITNLKTNS
jgi:hypothetical protein